ncbi:MAG: CpsB/CapC family capsule biosynthesis tyrosine phosphatase [Candidatus Palauibacterales bacterium]|nr:CpsB/CapC family capsule biosynthesis tyrosine phosphatase [Candidatus Palauibacterales bacterium]MDP2530105.1 CpsB/CapC family capsule biosynthesis tyrosine phosphatase [Candidatus Palauibacterales bacterium]MDP2582584.1 CpsB/CapC family capsule biosynthesis tyrosine phosphatase [Candidatus Palauibacterales bacterium]
MSDTPRLADLHCHLVPGVDDGAETFRDALVWLEAFAEDGITRVATTPHLPARLADSDYRGRVEDRFSELAARSEDRLASVELSLAFEIRLDGAPVDPADEGLWLGPGRHVLVEFQGLVLPAEPQRELSALLDAGLHPVLAHPERYQGIGDDRAWPGLWREMGVRLCVNAGSLWGAYGREPQEVARGMLARGEADLIGSDHHARPHRSDTVREAWDLLRDAGHPGAADLLAGENTRAVLDGGDLAAVPPAPLDSGEEDGSGVGTAGRSSWWRFLGADDR